MKIGDWSITAIMVSVASLPALRSVAARKRF
jgi:hypothetical protein